MVWLLVNGLDGRCESFRSWWLWWVDLYCNVVVIGSGSGNRSESIVKFLFYGFVYVSFICEMLYRGEDL